MIGIKGMSPWKIGRTEDEGVTHMGLRGLLNKGNSYDEAFISQFIVRLLVNETT